MSYQLLRKAYRLIRPSKSVFAMNTLFGKRSLGWTQPPPCPGFIVGKIFNEQEVFLPWFTYPAIAQLLRWSLNDQVIVEFGSGSSTMFFYEQGAKLIVSQEDNAEWFSFVQNSLPSSNKLEYNLANNKEAYVLSPSRLAEIRPTVVSIDGIHRADCADAVSRYINGTSRLDSPALVILDNSDWHGKSYSILSALDEFTPIDFYGHGPNNCYGWCTTFFVNLNSSFGNRLFASSCRSATPMANGLVANFSMEQ